MVNSMLSYFGLSQGFWGEAMHLVGYAEHSKDFRFYVIEPYESFSINSIIESKDAIFDENRFSSVPRLSYRSLKDGIKDIGGSVVSKEVTTKDDPKTFNEAMKSHDVAFWKEAINDEMDSIMGNNTWVLADLPLGCKWIFKRKLKVDETIKKVKSRLVIQGFRQKSRINYFDTYAPIARISTIRLMIAMTSFHNLIIHQMDVKATFLNGKLEEEILYEGHEVDVILGIKIKHESNGIAISPSYYIEKVLKKFNYFDCTPVSTPIDTSKKLRPNNGQTISQLKYSRVISCLMYAMTCTRPDIAFVVGKLSSAATLTKAYSQMYNEKSRHLDVRHNMICELIRDLVIKSAEGMRLNINNVAEWLGLPNSLQRKQVYPIQCGKQNIIVD
ncbi:zinc finger, CCHC-type containing protein [Tanacetum coccineum]